VSLPALIAILLGLSLTAYAIFGGADFGAGILDLLAGDRDADRQAIGAAIGPVWEANHVWLIFSITILFSAFPTAFSALGTALLLPLMVALLAIVLRSAALGLRTNAGPRTRTRAFMDRLFGAASLVAAFAFGAVAGGLAKVSSGPHSPSAAVPHIPWTAPFALLTGAWAAALCAQLASSFVAQGLARSSERRLAEHFRRRGLQSGACALLLSVAAAAVSATSAPSVWHRLIGAALPVLVVGLCAAGVYLVALWRRRYLLARGAGVLTAAAALWGWFVSQAPHLIGAHRTIHSAAASHAALSAIAIAGGVVLLLVLPAMYLLFAVFARPELEVIE
jgi:cytochrome d ubiquinol oxidase subunit II